MALTSEELRTQIATLTGQQMLARQVLHGGDLSDVYRITLDDHSTFVAKTGPHVAVEARMLGAMADASAPVPDVIGICGDLMLLEDLGTGGARGARDAALWAGFAEDLQTMHGCTAPHYGWPEEYAFGAVTIPGGWYDTWPAFWAEARLVPCLTALPLDLAQRTERLIHRLDALLPAKPAASLLHGDLWLGNIHPGQGRIWMIDPACLHGDAEVDLAFMHLFGTPHASFTQGYGALPTGAETRRWVYQLWPALVHFRLFGTGYRGMVTELLDLLKV